MLMFSGYRPLKNLMAVRFVHHRQWGSGCLRCPGNQSLAGEFQDLVADLQQLPVVADQDDPAAEILQGLADDRRGEREKLRVGSSSSSTSHWASTMARNRILACCPPDNSPMGDSISRMVKRMEPSRVWLRASAEATGKDLCRGSELPGSPVACIPPADPCGSAARNAAVSAAWICRLRCGRSVPGSRGLLPTGKGPGKAAVRRRSGTLPRPEPFFLQADQWRGQRP